MATLGLDPVSLCKKGSLFAKEQIRNNLDPGIFFIVNSPVSRALMKARVIKLKLIPYECSECQMGPEWRGKKLTLIIDHINGVHNDNRIDNLRFLCPNCNAQTDTFAGKNKLRNDGTLRATLVPIHDSCKCGAIKLVASAKCKSCSIALDLKLQPRKPKIAWPPIEELAERIKTTPMSTLSKELGVSDVALKKHLKKRGVETPGLGYWAKLRASDQS
jgi:hypothetical protein